jgi:drug/metabolite transporter (DMT)-like permease
VALATALLLLGEVPTPIQLLGAGLIVTSVVLNVRAHS